MAESTTMVASAVVIPRETRSPSPNLKRKLSPSISPSTERKRTRTDSSEPPALATSDITVSSEPITTPTTTDSTHATASSDNTAAAAAAAAAAVKPQLQSPVLSTMKPRSRADLSSNSTSEEKQRSRRLFSNLLGTLSQKPSSNVRPTAYARRDEIAHRVLARHKAEQADHEAGLRRKRLDVERSRREEQERWDVEGRRLRWAREREMAGFLTTDTEPVLFYKPWELRRAEEARIRRQKEEVEAKIEREERELSGGGLENEVESRKHDEDGLDKEQRMDGTVRRNRDESGDTASRALQHTHEAEGSDRISSAVSKTNPRDDSNPPAESHPTSTLDSHAQSHENNTCQPDDDAQSTTHNGPPANPPDRTTTAAAATTTTSTTETEPDSQPGPESRPEDQPEAEDEYQQLEGEDQEDAVIY